MKTKKETLFKSIADSTSIENLIERTSKDYDIDYEDVKSIYRKSNDILEFHNRLEGHIKERCRHEN